MSQRQEKNEPWNMPFFHIIFKGRAGSLSELYNLNLNLISGLTEKEVLNPQPALCRMPS